MFILLLHTMAKKENIALYQIMLGGRNRRGPDIFFPWFFAKYQEQQDTTFELYYFIKTNNQAEVKQDFQSRGISLDQVVFLPVQNNRFKKVVEMWQLMRALRRNRISLLQTLTFISPEEQLPQLQRLVGKLKLGFTVTYDAIPTAFANDYDPRFEKDRKKYGKLFKEIKLDGILSWYDDIEPFVQSSDLFTQKPPVYTIDSRFCDSTRYYPEEKVKLIVFASALANYKHPMMFLKALNLIKTQSPELLSNWKIRVIGTGPEEANVLSFIKENQLESMIEVTSGLLDISPILRKSMVYISTQEIENFPSLAMNEAMAAGNAIIARNVGRTQLFVKDGINGFLAETDDYQGIAKALKCYLADESLHKPFEKSSVELCETVHTPQNFNRQIDEFWTATLKP